MFENSATAEALFGAQSLRIDEKWLSELSQVVYFFIEGQSINLDSFTMETKNSMLNVFDKFKDERLNIEKIQFDDPEIENTVKKMAKLEKSDMKKSLKELREHMALTSDPDFSTQENQ